MSEFEASPLYVRLFNLLGALRDLAPFSVMTADEEQLLGDLVVRWDQTDSITVSEIMRETDRASSSTIYRRLIGLRDKGMIAMRVDQNDKRVKFVEPTAMAEEYMKHVSHNLDQIICSKQHA